jgi:hypothetical protein
MTKDDYGVWSIQLPNKPDGSRAIPHNTKVKVLYLSGDFIYYFDPQTKGALPIRRFSCVSLWWWWWWWWWWWLGIKLTDMSFSPLFTIKISMIKPDGERIERIPAYIRYATQDLSKSATYEGVFWNPPQAYHFVNQSPPRPTSLRIYEAHGEFFFFFLHIEEWHILPSILTITNETQPLKLCISIPKK